jgi:hypothetical protein
MVRTGLAVAVVAALVGPVAAQTVTFTTLGGTADTTQGATLTPLVRLVPATDPEAKAASAALEKSLGVDYHKPGTVAFSTLSPLSDAADSGFHWVLTGLPYSTSYLSYDGYRLRPYHGYSTSPYYSSYTLGAGAFQTTGWPGVPGPVAPATTVITNTVVTNTYTNTTRVVAPRTGTALNWGAPQYGGRWGGYRR